MSNDNMEFFALKQLRVRDRKNDDLFLIESAKYETLHLNGDQLIHLFLQILCWQHKWHTESPTHEGEDDVLKSINTLLEYYGGPCICARLKGVAQ